MLKIQSFYLQQSATFCHLIADEVSGEAALIDPVLDFDVVTGTVSHVFMDAILAQIKLNRWHLQWSMETHVHADHFTASNYVRESLGAKLVISDRVKVVQAHFDKVYDMQSARENSFDLYVKHGDTLDLGEAKVRVLETPGHTPACVSYVIEEGSQTHAFVGDTLLCLILALLVVISQEEMLHSYTIVSSAYMNWEEKRFCICATITQLPSALTAPELVWESSKKVIFTVQ